MLKIPTHNLMKISLKNPNRTGPIYMVSKGKEGASNVKDDRNMDVVCY